MSVRGISCWAILFQLYTLDFLHRSSDSIMYLSLYCCLVSSMCFSYRLRTVFLYEGLLKNGVFLIDNVFDEGCLMDCTICPAQLLDRGVSYSPERWYSRDTDVSSYIFSLRAIWSHNSLLLTYKCGDT